MTICRACPEFTSEVVHTHGALLEDNSYYPGGLKMEGISSSAVMVMPDAGDGGSNKYTYQGVYSEWDTDAGWNEFTQRSYDPQINRWTGVDPLMNLPVVM